MCLSLMTCALLLNAWLFFLLSLIPFLHLLNWNLFLILLSIHFLGPDEALHVIIASNLDKDKEEKLINLLRENKEDSRGY